jgi:hypothetical protein
MRDVKEANVFYGETPWKQSNLCLEQVIPKPYYAKARKTIIVACQIIGRQ